MKNFSLILFGQSSDYAIVRRVYEISNSVTARALQACALNREFGKTRRRKRHDRSGESRRQHNSHSFEVFVTIDY